MINFQNISVAGCLPDDGLPDFPAPSPGQLHRLFIGCDGPDLHAGNQLSFPNRNVQGLASRSAHAGCFSMALAGILSSQIIHRQFVEEFCTQAIPLAQLDIVVDRRSGVRPAIAEIPSRLPQRAEVPITSHK